MCGNGCLGYFAAGIKERDWWLEITLYSNKVEKDTKTCGVEVQPYLWEGNQGAHFLASHVVYTESTKIYNVNIISMELRGIIRLNSFGLPNFRFKWCKRVVFLFYGWSYNLLYYLLIINILVGVHVKSPPPV